MRKRWKGILAACCAAALIATVPGMTVLASEYQEETYEEVLEDLSEESSASVLQDDAEEVYEESGEALAADEEELDDVAEQKDEIEAPDEAAVPEITENADETDGEEDLFAGDLFEDVQEPQQEDNSDLSLADVTEGADAVSEEELTGWTSYWIVDQTVGTNVTATITEGSRGSGSDVIIYVNLKLTSNNGTLSSKWQEILDQAFEARETHSDWKRCLTEIVIEEKKAGGKLHLPKYSTELFSGCEKVRSMDLSGLDTSAVTDMSAMFRNCYALETLDISSFDTSKVTNMALMFSYCYQLHKINFSNFNTSKVTDMSSMFLNCGVQSLDLSRFDTSNVINMSSMFQSTMALSELDLSGFNTSRLRYMDLMFADNYHLKKLDLSSFDISKVEDYYEYGLLHALYDCYGLEVLKTPKKSSKTIALYLTMYDAEGKSYNSVPAMSKSITLFKSINLKNASISGVSLSYGYRGTAYTPAFTVTLGEKTLVAGTDYTYKFTNNINPGTAKLTVTGKGKYTGTKVRTFEIVDCVSEIVSGKTYQLIPKNNSKTAVSSFSGRMVNNTKVYITDRTGSEAMKFIAKKNSDGSWKFINAKCELAMAVQQNSSEVGKGVVLYDQTTKKAQNWKLTKKSDNSFGIINAVSGLYIDMSDPSAVKGTTLSMKENSGRGQQRFYIVETTAVDASYDGTYSIRASKNKNYAVDIAAASKENGANAQLYRYNGTNAQKFTAIYSGGGYYRLVNKNSGMVLTVKGNTKTNGANVIQSKWAGQSGQRWKITKNSNGTVTLKNVLGTVLHLNGNKIANGTNIAARNASTTGAQKWYLQK